MKKTISAVLAAALLLAPIISSEVPEYDLSVNAEAKTVKTAAPTGLKAVVSGTSVKLNWNKVSGAEGYRIYIYDSKDKKYKKYTDVAAETCTIDTLKGDKTYFFKVAALKNGKAGQKSEKAKAKPESAEMRVVNAVINNEDVLNRDFPEPYNSYPHAMGFADLNNDDIPELIVFGHDVSVYGHCGYFVYGIEDGTLKRFTQPDDNDDSEFYYDIIIAPDYKLHEMACEMFPIVFLTDKTTGETRYILTEFYGAATHMHYSVSECFFEDGGIIVKELARYNNLDAGNNKRDEEFKIGDKECSKTEFVRFYDSLFDKDKYSRKFGAPLDLMYSVSDDTPANGFVYSKASIPEKRKHLLSSCRKAVKFSDELKNSNTWNELEFDEYINELR